MTHCSPPDGAAFTDGLHLVAAISAALLAAVAVLVLATLRHLPPIGHAQPDGSLAAAPATAANPDHQHDPRTSSTSTTTHPTHRR